MPPEHGRPAKVGKLTQRMQFLVERGKKKEAVSEWDIFQAFAMDYVPPEDREPDKYSKYLPGHHR